MAGERSLASSRRVNAILPAMFKERYYGVEQKAAAVNDKFQGWGIEYVAFDFDDTLIDTRGIFNKGISEACGLLLYAEEWEDRQKFDDKARAQADLLNRDVFRPVLASLRPEYGIQPLVMEVSISITARLSNINKDSVSHNEKHLRERLKFLIDTYKQPVLVEEFIAGDEVTAMLVEGSNKKVYMAKKIFKEEGGMAFATFEDQWGETDGYTYEKYTDLDLQDYVKKAFDVLRMSDYGKFDIRIDQSGRYYFIDSNSNPAFGPKELNCAIANVLGLYDIDFNEILRRLLVNTMRGWRGKEVLPAPGE